MHLWWAVLMMVVDVLSGRMVAGCLGGWQVLNLRHHGLLYGLLHWQEDRDRKRYQLRCTMAGVHIGHRMMRWTAATAAQYDDLALLFGHHTDCQTEQQKSDFEHRFIFYKSLDSLSVYTFEEKKTVKIVRPHCWQPGCGLKIENAKQIYMKIDQNNWWSYLSCLP